MAGMPLFAHVGRGKVTPPPFSVPLKLVIIRVKFFSRLALLKPKLAIIQSSQTCAQAPARAGFACCAPQTRLKCEESRGFVRVLRLFCLCALGFREKLIHRPPELITKFPMPVARHENKKQESRLITLDYA